MLKIFNYARVQDRERAAAVCKQWRRVSLDPSLWKRLDLSERAIARHMTVRDKTLIRFVSRLRPSIINHIDLSGHSCRHLTNVSLFHIARHCSTIQSLNISGCKKITNTGIEVVVRHCLYLEVLELAKCNRITTHGLNLALRRVKLLRRLNVACCTWITDATLMNVAQHCRKLSVLNVEGCSKITDLGLNALASSSARLEHINLRNTRRITDNGMEQFLAAKKEELRALEIGIVRKSCSTAAVLTSVAEHCRHLQLLDFQDCHPTHVDDIICLVAERCHELRHLAVRPQCKALSASTIDRLTKVCPNLNSVEGTMRLYTS